AFYMNCADVAITGSESHIFVGKEMTIVNYPGFPTIRGTAGNLHNGESHYTSNLSYLTIMAQAVEEDKAPALAFQKRDDNGFLEKRAEKSKSSKKKKESSTPTDDNSEEPTDNSEIGDEKCDETGEEDTPTSSEDSTDETDDESSSESPTPTAYAYAVMPAGEPDPTCNASAQSEHPYVGKFANVYPSYGILTVINDNNVNVNSQSVRAENSVN
ncbi:hypothetical protein IWQ56_007357, partial [Coemansia nantahalensis]